MEGKCELPSQLSYDSLLLLLYLYSIMRRKKNRKFYDPDD